MAENAFNEIVRILNNSDTSVPKKHEIFCSLLVSSKELVSEFNSFSEKTDFILCLSKNLSYLVENYIHEVNEEDKVIVSKCIEVLAELLFLVLHNCGTSINTFIDAQIVKSLAKTIKEVKNDEVQLNAAIAPQELFIRSKSYLPALLAASRNSNLKTVINWRSVRSPSSEEMACLRVVGNFLSGQ